MFALMPWPRRSALLPRVEMPDELESVFDRLFNFPVIDTPEWPKRWGLTTEVNDKETLIRFEMPGFEPAEVKVEVIGEQLIVEAGHRTAEEKAGERTERMQTHVRRTITLPPGANLEKVEAIYRNGVLEIHLPRAPEALGRRIEVRA